MSRTFEVLSNPTPTPMRPPTTANVPATLTDTARNLLAASDGPAPILKFKKGHYYCGETEIPVGGEFIAFCADWTQGYIKFVDGELVDRRIGKVASGFRSPDRAGLGDLDEEQWPKGLDGQRQDPWTFQNYLPLENVETGDRYLFVTGSVGGKIGVQNLCAKYARNIEKGLPIISLAVGTFKSKKLGVPVPRPDFPVVGYENAGGIDVTPPQQLMDDEIPF